MSILDTIVAMRKDSRNKACIYCDEDRIYEHFSKKESRLTFPIPAPYASDFGVVQFEAQFKYWNKYLECSFQKLQGTLPV